MHPDKKSDLEPVLLLHSSFLGGMRKRVRNNQLSYKTGWIWNSPHYWVNKRKIDEIIISAPKIQNNYGALSNIAIAMFDFCLWLLEMSNNY